MVWTQPDVHSGSPLLSQRIHLLSTYCRLKAEDAEGLSVSTGLRLGLGAGG